MNIEEELVNNLAYQINISIINNIVKYFIRK